VPSLVKIGSGKEVENVKVYIWTDSQMDTGQSEKLS
jgi:hypothetical protein